MGFIGCTDVKLTVAAAANFPCDWADLIERAPNEVNDSFAGHPGLRKTTRCDSGIRGRLNSPDMDYNRHRNAGARPLGSLLPLKESRGKSRARARHRKLQSTEEMGSCIARWCLPGSVIHLVKKKKYKTKWYRKKSPGGRDFDNANPPRHWTERFAGGLFAPLAYSRLTFYNQISLSLSFSFSLDPPPIPPPPSVLVCWKKSTRFSSFIWHVHPSFLARITIKQSGFSMFSPNRQSKKLLFGEDPSFITWTDRDGPGTGN